MAKIGILSFSDGRSFVHAGISGFVAQVEGRIADVCQASRHTVVQGSQPVTSLEVAVSEARRLAASQPDLTSSITRFGRSPRWRVRPSAVSVGVPWACTQLSGTLTSG